MGLLSCSTLAFLSFLIAGPFPRVVEAQSCPGGWRLHKGNCYKLFQDKKAWSAAEADCQTHGRNGHLTSIASKQMGKDMAEFVQAYQEDCVNVWIGLQDNQGNGQWKWSDNSQVDFKGWLAGMPAKEHCTELSCQAGYDGWNDADCKTELPYICKYEA